MNPARFISGSLNWAVRHPGGALLAAMVLWAAGFTIYWNATAHGRFVGTFEKAVWSWTQAGDAIRLIESLSSS